MAESGGGGNLAGKPHPQKQHRNQEVRALKGGLGIYQGHSLSSRAHDNDKTDGRAFRPVLPLV